MSAPLYRGRIHGIVLPDGDDAHASAAQAALWDSSVPEADVVSVVVAGGGLDGGNAAAVVDNADYLVFVEAGTELDDDWLADCVAVLRQDPSTGLVGWSVGGRGRGELELFVSRAAFVVRHSAFHGVSGFDPVFGGGVHDVDLGWRTWLAGFRVRSVGPLPEAEARPLADPTAAAHDLQAMLASFLDASSIGPGWKDGAGRTAKRLGAGRRYQIQSGRRRGDGELLPLAHDAIRRYAATEPTASALVEVLETWGAPERAGSRRRIAVVTSDTLAKRMAGPGIRASQIARRLADEHEVVLATTGLCELTLPGLEVRQVGELGLRELYDWCDVFVFQGWVLAGRHHLIFGHKIVVADVYDPMHLEQLEQAYDAPGERGRFDTVASTTQVLNDQLERADFMLCASEKQRDLWLGQLAGIGRVNPVTYDDDESLRSLIAVAPFGIGDDPPVQTRSGIRGAIEGIGPDDKVILWGGGVYNWFDPLTLVHAVHNLSKRMPEVRLLFLGMKHPNPGVPQMRVAFETQELARELGIENTHVFFNTEWVEFDDRQNFLLDADLGVSTHLDHIETEFSFRTRILDYLWAELPIVATDGDSFATLIRAEGIGEVVPARDVEALELALERILADDDAAAEHKANIRRIAPAMRWSPSLEPLVEFCRHAHRAADITCPDLGKEEVRSRLSTGRKRDLEIAMSYLKAGAPGLVLQKVRQRFKSART